MRVLWQPAVGFWIRGVVQYIDDMRSANSRGVVHAGIGKAGLIAKLSRARFGEFLHFALRSEMQAARWARLDARGFEPLAHAIIAERALENLARRRTELRNIERASGHAVAAADAVRFLKVHDAVGVLHDGTIGRTRDQASRLRAMHALILAHEQHQAMIGILVLVAWSGSCCRTRFR